MKVSERRQGRETPARPTSSPRVPEKIGPYRLDDRLGQGGMGEVYRGFDERLQRPVALKRLAVADSHEARQRFRREARSVARIHHSAIVRLYDWQRDEGHEWIVMELVEGRSLRELIAEGRCAPRLAARLGRQIAEGLAAAHDAGLVHRDLKAENVMLTPGGEVRILDFGLAKPVAPEDGVPLTERISRSGEILGTATAMSPEQALGLPVDARSDLFSLGLLLYELLTGVLPFDAPTQVETLTRLCTLAPQPIIELAPEVPEALERIVEGLLEKDPRHRPASARAVAESLDVICREAEDARKTPQAIEPVDRTADGPSGEEVAAATTEVHTDVHNDVRSAVEADDQRTLRAELESFLQAHRGGGLESWRPAPGAEIPWRPNWRTERRLGRGGFGEAWLGRHHKSGAERIFKFCRGRDRIRSLQREITLFRLLDEELGHRPDIAAIVDWNLDKPPYFVESEYCSGGDLVAWLDRRGGATRVPLEERLEIVAQVADALAAAHSIGVLHKDVKPTNVLIEERGGSVQVRLGDFGVGSVTEPARLDAAGITALGLTTDSDVHGTPLYRAPEFLEGRGASVRADVYALGVMLYQMVVGDLSRALAPGWRRDVEDPELLDDIAVAVEGVPDRRLADAGQLARRLRDLEGRRQRRLSDERTARLAEEALVARRRRRFLLAAFAALLVFAVTVLVQQRQTAHQADLAALEADRALHEAEVADEVSEFLVAMFEGSNPLRAGRRTEDLSARALLDRGAERLADELADRPEIRSRLLATIGSAYVGLGSHQRGEELLRESLAIREAVFGEDSLEVADSLERLRHILRQGRSGRAELEALDVRILEIRERHLGPDHLDVAQVAVRLAKDRAVSGRDEGASELFARAQSIFERELGPDHPDVARVLAEQAIFHSSQARLDVAAPLMERALSIREKYFGPGHTELIHTLSNLSIIYGYQGRFSRAVSTARRTLTISEKELGDDHPETAQMMNNLGTLLVAAGRHDEAEPLLRRALTLFEGQGGSPRYAVRPLVGLGTIALERGDLDQAERHFLRPLEIWQKLTRGGAKAVKPLHGLAVVRARQGRRPEAEELFRQALEGLQAPNHPKWLRLYEDWAEFLRTTDRDVEALEVDERVRGIRVGLEDLPRQSLTP